MKKMNLIFYTYFILSFTVTVCIAQEQAVSKEQKKEAEKYQQQIDRQVDGLNRILCIQNFKKQVNTELKMCVSRNYQSNLQQMSDPWSQTRIDCNLSYTELKKYQEWYEEARTFQGTRC